MLFVIKSLIAFLLGEYIMNVKVILSIVITLTLNASPYDDKYVKAKTPLPTKQKPNIESIPPATQQVNPTRVKKISIKDATIEAINNLRSKPQICSSKPVRPLIWNPYFYEIAKEHSIDMAVNGKVQHDGSGKETDLTAKKLGLKRGSKFYERVNQKIGSRDLLSGELVIATSKEFYKTPKEILNYWINQPKSCKVIMDPRFSDVALSKVISNKNGKAYWTLLLVGKRQ